MNQMLVTGFLCALVATVHSTPVSPASYPGSNNYESRRSIPCDHPLRVYVPSLFTHCGTACYYSDWSAWQIVQQRVPTNKTQCPTKYYYTEQRTREMITFIGDSADCTEVNNTREICYPTIIQRLIAGLVLGGSAQNYGLIKGHNEPGGPSHPQSSIQNNDIKSVSLGSHSLQNAHNSFRFERADVYVSGTICPSTQSDHDRQVCGNLTERHRRSTTKYNDVPKNRRTEQLSVASKNVDNQGDKSAPIPFDWNIHGSHFRQRREARCSNTDIQRVLFVLDSSGSINLSNFNDMKEALAKLVLYFCKQIETALITFSSTIKLDYCFDCFENTKQGRLQAMEAIKGAQYMGQMTNTGATAKCICDNVLQSSCGIDNPSSIECLDVVFITDGQSNDPNLEVCEEIKCLHNQVGISTYAVGIGGYDPNELECIAHNTDEFGMFEFETFQDFKDSIDEVVELLAVDAISGNMYSCTNRDRSYSPTGSPFV